MRKTLIGCIFLSTLLLGVVACSSDDDTTNDQSVVEKSAVIENYANLVYQNYKDSYDEAKKMQTAIATFVATPNQANFDAAKAAWKAAREPYGQTEAFRFANGPIDDDDEPEGFLNAWPLDEVYVDYVDGFPNDGIINDITITIDKATLLGLNGPTQGKGEKNVSIGYHAIEFLLWGQDLTDPSEKKAGQRPYTDFVDGGTAANQDRRRAYLVVCAELLLDHLQSLLDEWKPGGAYRTTFLALDENIALKNMLKGIAELASSELAIERMNVALDLADQEDEHSCFSDNTHRDVLLNFEGIRNVYTGSYGTIKGTSLQDLVNEQNKTLGEKITQTLNTVDTGISNIAIPFDFAISGGASSTEGKKVRAVVLSLQALGNELTNGATALGIALNN
ncbi:imelysin family protein [Aquimarina sp. I32.4]|uniref:imelysin family protein n=1 Tax=Aquimarina sp. I32.4 TaxID=2053903 RepID=UPI000CDEBF20|nr:imelysin family protein [Aquimarina sp. I32.4]